MDDAGRVCYLIKLLCSTAWSRTHEWTALWTSSDQKEETSKDLWQQESRFLSEYLWSLLLFALLFILSFLQASEKSSGSETWLGALPPHLKSRANVFKAAVYQGSQLLLLRFLEVIHRAVGVCYGLQQPGETTPPDRRLLQCGYSATSVFLWRVTNCVSTLL